MQDSITMAEVGSIVKVSRQEDRNAVGAAKPRQHADEDAEHETQHHHKERLPAQKD
jgi:hypothetical protein